MAFNFEGLELKGVTELNRDELGRGAYGRVYAVKYCQTICAAKEIHSILIEGVGQVEMQRTVESFIRECRQCSTLRHPNVIQFLGVYYPTRATGGTNRMRLPVMVMEMMAISLTLFVDKHEKIPVHIKYSIIHDVSFGLCYLHSHDPPIVHRDLSPNNVLLTAHHVAKISDLGMAKIIATDSRKIMTQAPGTTDFMPPEALNNVQEYGPPMDSFAGIILHTFNQQWPSPSRQVQFDPKTRRRVALSEVERRQQYLDKMIGKAEGLRPLVEECLDDDPTVRPTIATVCERIQLLSSTRSITTQQVASEVTLGEGSIGKRSKLRKEAPPLMPTLCSSKYHIKWTQLADLPIPLCDSYFAIQHDKIFITGDSPVDDALHQVYVYDINTDQWDQLPPSGHYYGIPHIIGGRLVVIGGRLSATKKMTNKVSTFDEDSQTWTSYYPDLLSVRSRPGVVSHLEHVIVAGGGRPTAEDDDTPVVQDDIEVFNWIENSHWRKVANKLPVPMYGFIPICDDNMQLFISGYSINMEGHSGTYKIPVADITASIDQQHNSDTSTKWTELTATDHWYTALVPSLSPPVVVGGEKWVKDESIPTPYIRVYDYFSKTWKKIGSLSCARSRVSAAAVYNNAIVVIGGHTKGGGAADAKSSILTVVELGQAELLLHPTIILF